MPHTNPEEYRKYQREYYQRVRRFKRYDKKLKLLAKLGGKCAHCGYDKCPAALEFHHLDPSQKDFGVSDTFRDFAKLEKEVDKCIVLCANCHAEEHFKAPSSSGQDIALSRRVPGFESRWGHKGVPEQRDTTSVAENGTDIATSRVRERT